MKILAVCQYYWPESFQITSICEELARRGNDITVLTSLPNYPDGVIPERYRHGKSRRQVRNRVAIIRAPQVARGKSRPIELLANYLSYSCAASCEASLLRDDFDIVFAYQPSPVTMIEPALVYKQLRDIPLIIYCCDVWPECAKISLPPRLHVAYAAVERYCKRAYSSADRLCVQSPSFIDYYQQTLAISPARMRYIPQFGDDSYLSESFDCPHEGTNFLFMGNIGRAQDMPTVLRAISLMKAASPFRVHFVGGGSLLEQTVENARNMGLSDKVVFHGKQPYERMADYYRLADACLLTLDGTTWVGSTLPSRLQGYMAAGKPVLAAINGGAKHIIRQSGCGEVVPAGDAQGLASLMDDYIDHPDLFSECGEKGRDYYSEHFMFADHVNALEEEMQALVKEKQHGSN